MLTNYKAPPRLQRVCNPDGKGLAFVQGGGLKKDSIIKGKAKCWQCDGLHYKNECPKL